MTDQQNETRLEVVLKLEKGLVSVEKCPKGVIVRVKDYDILDSEEKYEELIFIPEMHDETE